MGFKYIFWDWNGTLLNDAPAACEAVNAMLSRRALPIISIDDYREMITVPIINFYKKVMDVSCETMESLNSEYTPLWESYLPSEPLADGAAEILDYFASLGMSQYIYSSSRNELIEPKLSALGISDKFVCVLGASDCHVGSKIERTKKFISDNSISPDEILFIGDMIHDLDTANAVGSDIILVASGHDSFERLKSSGKLTVSSLRELKELFLRGVV